MIASGVFVSAPRFQRKAIRRPSGDQFGVACRREVVDWSQVRAVGLGAKDSWVAVLWILADERQAPTVEVLKQFSRAGRCGCCAPVCGGSAATRVAFEKTAAGERSQGTGAVQTEASGAAHPLLSGPTFNSLSTTTRGEGFRTRRAVSGGVGPSDRHSWPTFLLWAD